MASGTALKKTKLKGKCRFKNLLEVVSLSSIVTKEHFLCSKKIMNLPILEIAALPVYID